MNKLVFALPMLLVVFLSGCVGQPSPTYTTTTTSTSTPTTPTTSTTSTSTTQTPSVDLFSIQVDDYGFYPSSTITVVKGDTVNITFTVKTTNVYHGGLMITSSKFNTGSIPPGGSSTVSFVADQSFSFTSYWPSTGVSKATGQVVAQ